jgi:hypothetical protein
LHDVDRRRPHASICTANARGIDNCAQFPRTHDLYREVRALLFSGAASRSLRTAENRLCVEGREGSCLPATEDQATSFADIRTRTHIGKSHDPQFFWMTRRDVIVSCGNTRDVNGQWTESDAKEEAKKALADQKILN